MAGGPVPGPGDVRRPARGLWLGHVQEGLCRISRPAGGPAAEDRAGKARPVDGALAPRVREKPGAALRVLGRADERGVAGGGDESAGLDACAGEDLKSTRRDEGAKEGEEGCEPQMHTDGTDGRMD